MMASPSELSLDCKPHSYSVVLKSMNGDQQTDLTQKLEEFLSRLEEERLKIDAFKRELPLCMQLLSNAMETSRQQLQNYRANQGPQPILEEFIPLKNSSSEGSDKASVLSMSDNKATWMTSAQLWSQASNEHHGTNKSSMITSPKETDRIRFNSAVSSTLGLETKQRNGTGAFIQFSKEKNSCPSPNLCSLPDLALASIEKSAIEDKKCSENENGTLTCSRRDNSVKSGGDVSDNQAAITTNGATPTNSQTHRKARRCWSPDLHRRFVNALQMLGGSQVATPKQIRELMKVDGLTNDEVKSHLQKYRLHTRRPSPSPQVAGNPTPQLVVLGGIWVPPEYAAAAHHGGAAALYGAHPNNHANQHYCAQQVPQEFYPASVQPQQLHHHTLHHQLHLYKPSTQNHSSPGSDLRAGTGDRSESIEDGKSESGGSWKADSGCEHGGEKKGTLVLTNEDGEESNGSEITLKF